MNLMVMRFALRRQRLELVVFALALLGLIALAAWMASEIFAVGLSACYTDPPLLNADECARRAVSLNQITGTLPVVQALAVFLPPLAGLFLGATVIARETESGTAMFAWTVSASRARWLLARVLPVLLIIALLGLLAGSAVDAIYAASYPYVPLEHNLIDFEIRGPLLMARALLAFSAALLIGAVVGRLLPALLLSLVLGAALLGGSMYLTDAYAHREPVAEPGAGAQITSALFKTPEGEILDGDQAVARLPRPDADLDNFYEMINAGIPGTRSIGIVAPATLGITALAALLIGATFVVVDRRRPY